VFRSAIGEGVMEGWLGPKGDIGGRNVEGVDSQVEVEGCRVGAPDGQLWCCRLVSLWDSLFGDISPLS
jgi:hypothetical protein